MNVLVEVHGQQELERACKLPLRMLGVNNRNLKTLDVDVQTSHQLASSIPDGVVKIAESGIRTHHDIEQLQNSEIYAYLVGESLMLEADIGGAGERLIGAAGDAS